MPDRARVRVVLRGLVQGVSFRAYTVDEARRLGVRGWVRNLAGAFRGDLGTFGTRR